MANETAVLETSMGTIEVELDRAHAPITVENFISYVESGFYDGLIFHRVIRGFMVQGGGMSPDGKEKAAKKPIKLESQNGLKNAAGTVAMARTNDPDSATCQFFLNTVNNDFLNYSPGNPGYAVFGKVVSGMDVVKAMEKARTKSNGYHDDWPVEPVVIKKVFLK
jgi:cyclophilin family peptidyl-prolyl cis-trans isomerase